MSGLSPVALMPVELLQWFDTAPSRYWVIAWSSWCLLALLVGLRLVADWHPDRRFGRRAVPGWLLQPLTFVLAATGAILAFRWPMVFAGPLQNPDETHLAASALTYWRDPVPWRSVDIHTSGPVNAYFLWPAMLINGRIDYAGLRLAALFCHGVAALACYGTLRRLTTEGIARLAVLPIISFVAFTTFWDFTQYSSEHVSICAISVATWLATVACCEVAQSERSRRWLLGMAGFLLGCIPFAKLQAAPLALALGGLMLVAGWMHPAGPRSARVSRLLAIASGAVTPAIIMSALLTIYGLWAQFQAAYIESNRLYSAGYAGARSILFWDFSNAFVSVWPGTAPFFWGSLGVAASVALVVGILRLEPRALLTATWTLMAIAIWSVVYPGRAHTHYLQLAFVPLAWLSGVSLIATFRACEKATPAHWLTLTKWTVTAAYVAIAIAPQIYARARENHPVIGNLLAARLGSLHPVSARLRELARPGDTLTVWGWVPRLHSETGLAQGTREAHSFREIEPGPMLEFYRQRYLRDLRRKRPAFIVDAVCPGSFMFEARDQAGLQVFPELARYVAENYRLAEEIAGFHLYLRLDR